MNKTDRYYIDRAQYELIDEIKILKGEFEGMNDIEKQKSFDEVSNLAINAIETVISITEHVISIKERKDKENTTMIYK